MGIALALLPERSLEIQLAYKCKYKTTHLDLIVVIVLLHLQDSYLLPTISYSTNSTALHNYIAMHLYTAP